jgi:glycosyltransferase involved in cell wall biosynthesis
MSPRVAAVIPAYGQPGLLAEAILGVLHQTTPAYAVVVDDGCRCQETRDVALSFARAAPGRVMVLSQPNGGLAAARNRGVDFALAHLPSLEALMFLDADNRIAPLYLARALAALSDAPADVGWVYPDIDMIGLDESRTMRGAFSQLYLIDYNYCDAGGVVRRALLQTGLRFDETLKRGFEDWDFWLQAAEAGYRGQHLPNAGFGYRRRGESMLTTAHRKREIVADEMNRKRRGRLTPKRLWALEEKEAPRFALIAAERDFAVLSSDPAAPGRKRLVADLAADLRAFQAAPGALHVPPLLAFGPDAARAALGEARLTAWAFWLAQVRLRAADRVRLRIAATPGPEVRFTETSGGTDEASALIFVASLRFAEAPLSPGRTVDVRLELPGEIAGAIPGGAALAALEAFRAVWSATPPRPAPEWRRDPRPARNDLVGIFERACGSGVALPLAPDRAGRGDIGFLLPIHAFGGVEKVVEAQARALRAAGFRPHLFVGAGGRFLATPGVRETFASVSLLPFPTFEHSARGYDYFGAPMSGFEHEGDAAAKRDALGLLAGMDAVIAAHSLGGLGLAASLRGFGVTTLAALHLTDRDRYGAPSGVPPSGLAYEHGFDRFVVISDDLVAWCVAHGIPEDKILLVRNAPGYVSTRPAPARREAGPLRALFLGRLDPQKGVDRLAEIIAATRGVVSWRVIGAPVLQAGPPPELGVKAAAPIHAPEALDAAYDWADVLVAPSRFEGVPLTMLEARRRGVVPLVTDVGAVREAIGAGGYLIEAGADAAVVAAFVERLTALAGDPALLSERRAAVLTDPPPDWEATTAGLAAYLSERIRRAG